MYPTSLINDEIVATEHIWRTEKITSKTTVIPSTPGGPSIEIPDEEPPLAPPGEDDSTIEIPDDEPPLAPPSEDGSIEIPDEVPPLVDIPDEDVPLASVPKTGDTSALWIVLAILCGICILGVVVYDKKRREV